MSQDTVLSLEEALARIDHDWDVFQAMAKLFVDQGPKDLAEIKMALVVEDAAALARSAHRLKGAILQFCAPAAFEATREFEELGKSRYLKSAKDAPKLAAVHALRAGAVAYLHKTVAENKPAHSLQRARHLLPGGLANVPSIRRSEYRVTIDSDPACIPRVISWLIRTTASTLPETQQLHLHGSLHELVLNAVEHGTLELGFQMKQRALAEGRYEAVLRRRVAESRFKDRQITIQVYDEKEVKRLTYCIIDEGKGFMWRRFLTQSPDAGRTAAVSGRGIFLARSYFPSLTYNDRGNEVTITVPLA